MIKSNSPTKAQKFKWGMIRDLGCMVCGQVAEIHHCETGIGRRKNHDKVIPLCTLHHRGNVVGLSIHSGKRLWENVFGTEQFLMQKVNELLRRNLSAT
jgi:hypothetical protein